MQEKQRQMLLGGVLVLLLGYLGATRFGLLDGFSIKENSAEAGQQKVPTVTKDKLQVSKLAVNKQGLKSTNNKNPFDNPLDKQTTNNNAKDTNKQAQNNKTQVSTKPLMNANGTTSFNGNQTVDNTKSLKIKAIAISNDRMIAVIDGNGKTVSATVGDTVNNYIVTDISSNTVTIEDLNGQQTVLAM